MSNNTNKITTIDKNCFETEEVFYTGLYSKEAEEIIKQFLYGPVKYFCDLYYADYTENYFNNKNEKLYTNSLLKDYKLYYKLLVKGSTLSRMYDGEIIFIKDNLYKFGKYDINYFAGDVFGIDFDYSFYQTKRLFIKFINLLIFIYETELKYLDYLDQNKLKFLGDKKLKDLVKALSENKKYLYLIGNKNDPLTITIEKEIENAVLAHIDKYSYDEKFTLKHLNDEKTYNIISKSERLYNRTYGMLFEKGILNRNEFLERFNKLSN